jgi:hypothetical protein
MRYGDMMNLLKQDIAWSDETASPDAVLVLEPKVYDGPGWLDTSNRAETPIEIDGKYVLDFLREAQPLPKEFIPKSISIAGYNYKYAREIPRKRKWPENVPQIMPDFYALSSHKFMVSSLLREVFDVQSPGSVEYIEIDVKTPPDMIRASAYYFINVLPQARMIDWRRVNRSALGGGPGDPITLSDRRYKAVPFKPFVPGDPLIWHEMSLDDEHCSVEMDILVRGKLWNILIENFPQQFRHRNQLSHYGDAIRIA